MKLSRFQRARYHDNILPLVDVVFFLLVFFMLMARMDATAPFDVTPAFAVSGRSLPGGGTTVSVSADGRLALDGRPMSAEAAVESVSQRIADTPDLLVRLNVHRDAPLRFVVPLTQRLRLAGARDVVLVVTPEEAPP